MENASKLSMRDVFDRAFASKDKYFGEWFISADDSLSKHLESYQNTSGINLSKQLSYLYLYLEALEILKQQGKKLDGTVQSLMSTELWYCNVLLLLVGLIDQHTKHEVGPEGKLKTQGTRFSIVMGTLHKNEKQHLLQHYGGHSKFLSLKKIASHLYSTRTFFAHEIIQPKNQVPQDGYLAIGSAFEGNENTFYINLPHGQLFLYIVTAFLRYTGYDGEIEIKSEKKFDKLVDLMRRT